MSVKTILDQYRTLARQRKSSATDAWQDSSDKTESATGSAATAKSAAMSAIEDKEIAQQTTLEKGASLLEIGGSSRKVVHHAREGRIKTMIL